MSDLEQRRWLLLTAPRRQIQGRLNPIQSGVQGLQIVDYNGVGQLRIDANGRVRQTDPVVGGLEFAFVFFKW